MLHLCKHYNMRPFYTWFIIPAMIYVPSLNETVYEAMGINQTLPFWGVILRSQTHGRQSGKAFLLYLSDGKHKEMA